MGGALGKMNRLMLVIPPFSGSWDLGVKTMKQRRAEMRWVWPCRAL